MHAIAEQVSIAEPPLALRARKHQSADKLPLTVLVLDSTVLRCSPRAKAYENCCEKNTFFNHSTKKPPSNTSPKKPLAKNVDVCAHALKFLLLQSRSGVSLMQSLQARCRDFGTTFERIDAASELEAHAH